MSQKAIINARIYTVDEQNNFYESGTILWENDCILNIGSTKNVILNENVEIIDAHDRLAILPGFIDVHSHSSLLKGFTENLPFLEWLPAYQREHKVLTEEDAYWASMVSYLEALKSGTTCVLDMYRFMHKAADVAGALGIRTHLAPYVADLGQDYFETMALNEKLIKTHHQSYNNRIQILVGLEHLFYCSPEAYKKARSLSDEYGVYIHTHTSEFKEEVDAVKNHFGKLPGFLLHERSILTPKTIIAHCVYLTDDELTLFKDNDVRVAHCPTSNVKLGGGSMQLDRLKEANIKFGLGTDGSISNNSLSMWELMKFGSLLQKNINHDATALNAIDTLRLATIEGAKVLGQDHEIGSLEIGKKADFMTINLWQPHLMPLISSENHDPVLWNLIYAGRASDIQDVWVDGKQIVSQGKITSFDEDELLMHIHLQAKDLLKRREGITSSKLI